MGEKTLSTSEAKYRLRVFANDEDCPAWVEAAIRKLLAISADSVSIERANSKAPTPVVSSELRRTLADFLRRANNGESFIVKHYERDVAVLLPIKPYIQSIDCER